MLHQQVAVGEGSTALGYAADADGDFSICIGSGAARAPESICLGENAFAGQIGGAGDFAVAVGSNAEATELSSTALGHQSRALGNHTVAVGGGKYAWGYSASAWTKVATCF